MKLNNKAILVSVLPFLIFAIAFTPAGTGEITAANTQRSSVSTIGLDKHISDEAADALAAAVKSNSDYAADTKDMTWAMANIASEADVYEAPDIASASLGRIFFNTQLTVDGCENGWAHVTTGNLSGYIPVSNLMFGDEGRVLMNVKCSKEAVMDEEAGLYTDTDLSSKRISTAHAGEVYAVTGQPAGWFKVAVGADTYFIPGDAAHIELLTQDGMTTDEIAAAEAAAEAVSKAGTAGNNGAVAADIGEEELLAAILFCEAGTNYEGDCAVGAVIMNRVRSSSFPDTISDVIYQSGQFSPVASGKLARVLASGVPDICYEAARTALSRYTNIGDCLYFHAGTGGLYDIGGNTFN